MPLHRANCQTCPWSAEGEDLVAVSEEMERHARKEVGHDVDLERAVATDGGSTYAELAIDRGRPTESCDCLDCECPLHTYPGDMACIWCRNGDHHVATDGGAEQPICDNPDCEAPVLEPRFPDVEETYCSWPCAVVTSESLTTPEVLSVGGARVEGASYRVDCWACGEQIAASATYCPGCGEVQFQDDEDPALATDGGVADDTDRRPTEPSLWCGQHGRWEPTARACDDAFDPDEVDWLVRSADTDDQDDDLVTDDGVAAETTWLVKTVVDRLRDPNPFDSADDRRKWKAAGAVSNGPASRVHVAAHLDGPRRSHALHEGHALHAGTERDDELVADGGEDISLAFLRLTELADARGDVPEDGSGIDGVWTDEIPDVDTDYQWFIVVNADDEEREYDVGEDRTTSIKPFHAHAWHNTELVVPSTILDPYGGEAGVTDEFDRRVEDQLIASVEAVLVELGELDEPVIYDEEVSA